MNTDQGRLFYATGIDNSQLRNDAAESRNILASIGKTAEQEGHRMDALLGKLSKAAGGFFAISQVKDFTKQIVALRGEIQSLEISFETLLNSREKGQAMFSEIRSFAASTPMMMNDLAKGAQTMLAFNIEAEKVMPMLRAIGDISMGDAGKFNSLSLAFSQMSATGKLMGQDLLQMINAGFNPLSVISEKTGKSIGDLKEEMEKGKISVDMVTDAFISATSAGGKFYGMLEKQGQGINGAMAQLQGAIDDMFNEIGTAGEGAAVSAMRTAGDIVKHYKEVGEILMTLVGMYGVYKAVIIGTEAVKRSVTTIKHADEAAQLYTLMSAEQKAKISKLELASTSEAYHAAVVAEMKTEMERQIQLAQSTQVELTAARERLAVTEAEKTAAAERVAMRQAELQSAIQSATTEQQASITKKMAAESEAQSRAALLTVKLEEQKTAAIAQVKALKEAGASEEVIAAKNREIATISNKIATARAEEIQHSRNVVALRKELAAQLDATNSKKIATATTALETAQDEFNTASKAKNAASRDVLAKKATIETAVKKAGTIETAMDTAATTANATASGFLASAKTKLTAAASKLNAVIMANPWALAAAGAIALGYGIYKLATYETEAEKATKKLNKAIDEAESSIRSENVQISYMFSRLKAAKQGTKEYEDAKQAIINQYGTYLSGLSKEISSLQDVEGAYRAVAAAAKDAARARAMDSYIKTASDDYVEAERKQKDNIKKLLEKRYGDKTDSSGMRLADKYYWEIVNTFQEGANTHVTEDYLKKFDEIHTYSTPNGQTYSYTTNDLRDALSKVKTAKTTFDNNMKKAEEKFGAAPEEKTKPAKEAKKESEYNKKDWEDFVKTKQAEYDTMTEAERESEKGRKLAAEILKGNKKVQAYNVSNQNKTAAKAADVASGNTDTLAKEAADRLKQSEEYARKMADQERDNEMEIRQARIDAMQDGFDKEIQQNQLNYDRLEEQNKRRLRDMLDAVAEERLRVMEDENPTAFKKTNKDGKLEDDPGKRDEELRRIRYSLTIDDLDPTQKAQIEEFGRLAQIALDKANEDGIKKMLSDYLTYEQQRFKIEEEYKKRRDQLYEKDESGNVMVDEQGNKVFRKGASQGNIEEINRQETEALKGIDEQFASREETYRAWCEEIANLSLIQLNAVLEQAKKNLDELEKSGTADPKQLAQARAKVNTAQQAVNKANAKNQVNPGKRSIKEWEDLYKTLKDVEQEFASMGDTIGGTIGEIISECGQFATSTLSMINGIVQLTQMSAIGIQGTAAAGATAISTMEKASVILTIISAALQIAMQIINLFNNDKKKEERIKDLQDRIDKLQRSYDRLGKSIDQVFSKDASNLIKQQNTLLEQQKILIQQQIAAEKSKKKTDDDRIKDWQEQLEDINELIDENKKKAVDAIFGSDIKSAIESFESALSDAWENQGNAARNAKDMVKEMMRQMVQESMKAAIESSGAMERIRKKLEEFYSNNILEGWEQDYIYNMAEELQRQLDQQFSWSKSLFEADDYTQQQGTAKSVASMSQDTGDAIAGRMTALCVASQEIRLLNISMEDSLRESLRVAQENKDLMQETINIGIASMAHLETIANNTSHLIQMREDLEKIERHVRNL